MILSVLTRKSRDRRGRELMTGGVTTRTNARALGVRRWSGRIARGESIGESVGPSSGASPSSRASSSASITARGSRPRRASAAVDSPARLTRCSVPPARGASPRGARIPRVASAPSAKARRGPGLGRRTVRPPRETREGRRRRRRWWPRGRTTGTRTAAPQLATEATATREGARDARPVPSAARRERARIRRGAGTAPNARGEPSGSGPGAGARATSARFVRDGASARRIPRAGRESSANLFGVDR